MRRELWRKEVTFSALKKNVYPLMDIYFRVGLQKMHLHQQKRPRWLWNLPMWSLWDHWRSCWKSRPIGKSHPSQFEFFSQAAPKLSIHFASRGSAPGTNSICTCVVLNRIIQGKTAEVGHYVSHVREKGTWKRFNDSRVNEISEPDSIRSVSWKFAFLRWDQCFSRRSSAKGTCYFIHGLK